VTTRKTHKAAILGATGPTGIHLTHELLSRDCEVRVVARHEAGLQRHFGRLAVERRAADMLDPEAAIRAIEGCDITFDCIGLPSEHMADHPRTARNIASALNRTSAHGVQVSSFWSYLPTRHLPVDEQHPRQGGVEFVQLRREAEDILQQAGAAIVQLPDFYGPEVHTSTLQQALQQAASGRFDWVGTADTQREYIYVPDAMRLVADLAEREQAYAQRWLFPGSGPLSATDLAAICSRILDKPIKVRAAPLWMLRLIGLFNKPLRQFLPMAPYYVQPIRYDAGKLRGLLGDFHLTDYEIGIRRTLDWLERHPPSSTG
jgi:nucleoside-diphosphate-sugar epimerase